MQIVFRRQGDMPKHQRLRSARIRAGFKTARDAATSLNVPYGTYSGHEAGSRGIKEDELKRYAQFFRVSASWLLFGNNDEGSKSLKFSVVKGIAGKSADGQIQFLSDNQIELMPFEIAGEVSDLRGNIVDSGHKLPMPRFMIPIIDDFMNTTCIKIEGDKISRWREIGTVLYFQSEKYEDIDGFARSECICWMSDGSALIDKPTVNNISGRRIVSVSPLLVHLTATGLSSWLEGMASAFMQAAQAGER